MSKVYGLFFGGHNHSTTLIIDGEIKYAIEDERVTRRKAGESMGEVPINSLIAIEEASGIKLEDSDLVVISDHTYFNILEANKDVRPWFDHMNVFVEKLKKVSPEKILWLSHHNSHAYSTYFISGFNENTLIVTSDGGSYEMSYGSIYYSTNNHKFHKVKDINLNLNGSISNLWFYACKKLGWKPLKDEGKIVGLAGHGKYDPYIYNMFSQMISYKGDLEFTQPENGAFIEYIYEQLEADGLFESKENRANFAYNLQKYTEDIFIEYLKDIKSKFPEYTKLCLAGGLFANVKLNQQINECGLFEDVFICPAMGDNGLSLGAALYGSYILGEYQPKPINDVFWGIGYSQEQVREESKNWPVVEIEGSFEKVGELLNEGAIIGTFHGRYEFGPRALGARSIVVRPTNKETHEILNTRLKRSEIMPFAPFVMAEHAHNIFNISGSEHTAEFMTMCYTAKPEWINKIPAVIHEVDNSARPQIVHKEKNPVFWNIANEYNKLSNIPVLMNTSFNGHGEPIIDAPEQAFRHLSNKTIDYLFIENILYKHEN